MVCWEYHTALGNPGLDQMVASMVKYANAESLLQPELERLKQWPKIFESD